MSFLSPTVKAGLSVLSVGNNVSPQVRLQYHLSRAAPHRVLHGPQCNLTPSRVQGTAGEQVRLVGRFGRGDNDEVQMGVLVQQEMPGHELKPRMI